MDGFLVISVWADPVGQYVYPADVPKAQQHFRVKLGEEQVIVPGEDPEPEVGPLNAFVVSGTAASITFVTIDGYIVNVVKNGVASSVKASDIVRVVWNGDIAGWDTSVNAPYKSALTLPMTMLSVPVHDIGIVRLIAVDGTVYSLNTAKTQLVAGEYLDSRSLFGY